MVPDPDELAGVADLFGVLARGELVAGLRDLAARSGEPFDDEVVGAAIDAAVEGYYLVEVGGAAGESNVDDPGDEGELLVAGPTALPTLPDGGEDLPHLLGVERRSIDPAARGEAAVAALRADAARAVDAGDEERIQRLIDVCYDVEAWAPVDTATLRGRLDDAASNP